MRHLPFRVRWGDCDPAGIVYYPRFLEYMNDAAHGLVEASGYSLSRMEREFAAIGFPMVSLSVEYRSPMRLGEEGVVQTQIVSLGRSSAVFSHRVLSGERLVAEARETRVFTARGADGALGSLAIPAALREALLGAKS